MGVHERDENRGNVEELRRETRVGVQAVLCGRLEKSCVMESSEPDGARQCLNVGQEGIVEKRNRTLFEQQRAAGATVSTWQYCKNHSMIRHDQAGGERRGGRWLPQRAPWGLGGLPIDSERISWRRTQRRSRGRKLLPLEPAIQVRGYARPVRAALFVS